MKKFWQLGFRAFIIITIWWVAIALFAHYRVDTYGVNPTFPYYHTILKQSDPVNGVWAHFDGVHYLKLAEAGYVDIGTQAFFPVYPILIHVVHDLTGLSYLVSGRVISYISLVLAATLIMYLVEVRSWKVVIALLFFPTSFFLAGVYTESLFLFETLLFFLLIRKKQFFMAAIVAGIASGTRIVGSMLMISLLVELVQTKQKLQVKHFFYLLISVTGLLSYMYFLWKEFKDPIMFIHVQSMFASGRSNGEIIFLPQLIYRYMHMFTTVYPYSLVLGRAIFEFVIYGIFIYLLWKIWKKIPYSWSIYVFTSMMLPALSGTLSSIPRYLIVVIPLMVSALRPIPSKVIVVYILISGAFCLYLLSLFSAGLFVA